MIWPEGELIFGSNPKISVVPVYITAAAVDDVMSSVEVKALADAVLQCSETLAISQARLRVASYC